MRDKSVQFCEAAFPLKDAGSDDQLGMSLRDYFAAKALHGLLACPARVGGNAKAYANISYEYADAMLKARYNP